MKTPNIMIGILIFMNIGVLGPILCHILDKYKIVSYERFYWLKLTLLGSILSSGLDILYNGFDFALLIGMFPLYFVLNGVIVWGRDYASFG